MIMRAAAFPRHFGATGIEWLVTQTCNRRVRLIQSLTGRKNVHAVGGVELNVHAVGGIELNVHAEGGVELNVHAEGGDELENVHAEGGVELNVREEVGSCCFPCLTLSCKNTFLTNSY